MQLITERITYHSRSDQFHCDHLPDLHVGARACDEKLLRQHIRTILDDPAAIVTLGGLLPALRSRVVRARRDGSPSREAARQSVCRRETQRPWTAALSLRNQSGMAANLRDPRTA